MGTPHQSALRYIVVPRLYRITMLTIEECADLERQYFKSHLSPSDPSLTSEQQEYLRDLEREIRHENYMIEMCETHCGAIHPVCDDNEELPR